MSDDDLYRLLVVRGYPQHEAAHIAAGPHPERQPDEPAEHALLYRFASAVASEEGPDHLDQQAARRWMADDFARTERQQPETKAGCQHDLQTDPSSIRVLSATAAECVACGKRFELNGRDEHGK